MGKGSILRRLSPELRGEVHTVHLECARNALALVSGSGQQLSTLSSKSILIWATLCFLLSMEIGGMLYTLFPAFHETWGNAPTPSSTSLWE